jgi:zinc protease
MKRALALTLLLLPPPLARAEEKEPVLTSQVLGIEEYLMPNGLRVLLYADATAPKVTVNLTVLVGSIHEGAGEAGMAHVFEHVLFHSAEGFPDIAAALKELGANYNGSTWFERTNYFETVSATDENLETAIRLEAARLGRAVLDAGDLEREGKIVESEFDMNASSPQRLVLMGMFGAMFDFHDYARSPIGTLDDFKALKVENIRAFYKRYYRPDNAFLIVTGKFDTKKTLALVQTHFGSLKGTGEGRPVYTTREPASLGERRFVVRKPGEAHVVLAAYRSPGAAHADSAVADVWCRMLATGNAGPLHEGVVGRGLAGSVMADTMNLRMSSPLLVMATVPREKDADAAEAAILEILEKGAGALTPADLDRAKTTLERDYERLFNDAESLAMAFSESESAGGWQLVLVRREQTKGVTLEQVKEFAAKYVRRENRVVGRFTPDDDAVAVLPDAEPAVKTYDPLLGKLPKTSRAVKEFDYSPASLQAAVTWTDAGPAKVGHIRKEVKGDRVHLQIFLPLAGRKPVFEKLAAGEALATLMLERTKDLAKEQLKTKLAGLKSTIGAGVSIEGASVSVDTTKDNLAETLKLATELLRAPFVAEDGLKAYVQRTRDRINAQRDEPMLLMQTEVPRLLFPDGDPRRGRTPDEQIAELEKLDVAAVLRFHAEFLGADGAIAGVVGDVAPEDLTALLAPLFSGWKAEKPGVLETNEPVEKILQAEVRAETPGKPSAFSVLVQPIRLSMASPDYAAAEAAGGVLFMDMMASRIPKKVRVEKALSYATGGMIVADPRSEAGMVVIFTMTKPENAAQALELIRTELAEARKGGVTEEELAAHKKSYANRVAQSRADDGTIAGAIVSLRAAGRDFGMWAAHDEATAKLTVEDVNAALRKYLDASKMGLVQVGDFEGKGKKKKKSKKEKKEGGEGEE